MIELLLASYLLLLLAMFVLQRQMIYLPERYSSEGQAEWMRRIGLQPWPSVANMRGMIGDSPVSGAKGTILVFHGNAGAAVHRTYYLDALQRLGYRIILAEYPGYGARSGVPSETVLIEDGIAAAKLAAEQFPGPLFLCGESLGSGVVSGVVASRQIPIKGLLLIAPFDSLSGVAQHHYWYVPARWLVRDKFDNLENLRAYRGNVAVMMAGQDEVIPNQRTLALFDSLAT
jgi:pimeloyl-ACP methyl ester carboxylesterase